MKKKSLVGWIHPKGIEKFKMHYSNATIPNLFRTSKCVFYDCSIVKNPIKVRITLEEICGLLKT